MTNYYINSILYKKTTTEVFTTPCSNHKKTKRRKPNHEKNLRSNQQDKPKPVWIPKKEKSKTIRQKILHTTRARI